MVMDYCDMNVENYSKLSLNDSKVSCSLFLKNYSLGKANSHTKLRTDF